MMTSTSSKEWPAWLAFGAVPLLLAHAREGDARPRMDTHKEIGREGKAVLRTDVAGGGAHILVWLFYCRRVHQGLVKEILRRFLGGCRFQH
jgi:hypothetical protein